MYSLLLYNEIDTSPIQYTKNINGTASHVDAIRKIQEKYNTLRQYRKQFATCSCRVVNRTERKKYMINYRKNNTIKQWSHQRKKYSWKKNNLGIGKMNRKYRKNCPKIKKIVDTVKK